MTYMPPPRQHDALVKAALGTVLADHYAREDDPHADAQAEYCDETLALAAVALVRAVDKLPPERRPADWPMSGVGDV